MTINATAAILLALYVAVATRHGVDRDAALRHDPERHPQGVHRARHLHLSRRGRRCASSTDIFAFCAQARAASGTRSRSPATTCARRARPRCRRSRSRSRTRSPTCEAAIAAGPGDRRLRAASLVLLQRRTTTSSRRSRSSAPPGGCGRASCASASAPRTRAAGDAALPHADGGLDPDGAAAREQRRARDAPGAGRGARRHAVAAHQRDGRGAGAADRARGARSRLRTQQVIAPRDGRRRHRRSRSRGSYFVEALTDRDRERGARLHREDRRAWAARVRAIERGFQQREIHEAAYRWQKRVEIGRRRGGRREPLHRERTPSSRRSFASTTPRPKRPPRPARRAAAPAGAGRRSKRRSLARGEAARSRREPHAADPRRGRTPTRPSARSPTVCARSSAATTRRSRSDGRPSALESPTMAPLAIEGLTSATTARAASPRGGRLSICTSRRGRPTRWWGSRDAARPPPRYRSCGSSSRAGSRAGGSSSRGAI